MKYTELNYHSEAFTSFVNITLLTLERWGWFAKANGLWTPYDQNYIDHVREGVESIFWREAHTDSPLPDDKRIEKCQKEFESLYGLHIYKAWGAWTEGYFDNFSKCVKAYNVELYKDSIAFGEG